MCNCKKRKEPVVISEPLVEIPKVEMVPETKDWYNNIDVITPISGQTQN